MELKNSPKPIIDIYGVPTFEESTTFREKKKKIITICPVCLNLTSEMKRTCRTSKKKKRQIEGVVLTCSHCKSNTFLNDLASITLYRGFNALIQKKPHLAKQLRQMVKAELAGEATMGQFDT